MRLGKLLGLGLLFAIMLGLGGCGRFQTLSTPNVVTGQDFGCGGDVPSHYAPYCMQPDE